MDRALLDYYHTALTAHGVLVMSTARSMTIIAYPRCCKL